MHTCSRVCMWWTKLSANRLRAGDLRRFCDARRCNGEGKRPREQERGVDSCFTLVFVSTGTPERVLVP